MMTRQHQMLIICGTIATVVSVTLAQESDDEESLWNISAGARYLSRYTAYGVDLGNDRAALGYQIGMEHASGLEAGLGAIQTLGTGGSLQHWSIDLGYTWQALDWLSFSAEYSHYEYSNDSANVLAPLANSVSVGLDTDLGAFGFGLSYDTYLGTNSASYISADLSSSYLLGDFVVVPLVQTTFMSQTIEDRLLKSSSGKGSGGSGKGGGGSTAVATVSTITGLSSLSVHLVVAYPIVEGLTVSIHPYYLYSPKAELSTKTSQFLWSAGISYSLDL